MVKRNLTGAGYGLGSWLQQRLTAIVMLVFAIAFLAFVVYAKLNVDANISSWQALFQSLIAKIFVQVFFLAVVIHAWVGIRDFWMDYIKSAGMKITLYLLTILWLLGCLIYTVKVIWA